MIRNALIIAGCFGMGLSQEGDFAESSQDVIVNGVVPQASQGAIPLNKVIDAVVGVVNEGSEAINVTSVAGSLTSPYDSNYFYQNVRFFFFSFHIHSDTHTKYYSSRSKNTMQWCMKMKSRRSAIVSCR